MLVEQMRVHLRLCLLVKKEASINYSHIAYFKKFLSIYSPTVKNVNYENLTFCHLSFFLVQSVSLTCDLPSPCKA